MVDYSVYLVTDPGMVPASSTFNKQVENSLNGGASLVQLREKNCSTLEFIERATAIKQLTAAKGVPLIINDRVDVALAIDAEGVHVGQDDMPAVLVRKLIGPDKILGVTCSKPEDVEVVCQQNVADYVGIGTVYKTNTKKDTKTPDGTGPIGIRKMLQVLRTHNQTEGNRPIHCVAIGGINEHNVTKVMYQCAIEGQALDGVAVVSCIMANPDAYGATKYLKEQMAQTVPWEADLTTKEESSQAKQLQILGAKSPLVHHITNNVVKNFCANVCLAIGASPIMSELAEEFHEFTSTVPHLSLVLNLGTPTAAMMDTFITAVQTYNASGKHVIFDPVAAGATSARLECSRRLLNAGHMSVIKGNVGEISAIWKLSSDHQSGSNEELAMRGVDSVANFSPQQIIAIGKSVSKDFKCVVVITGATNYIVGADGRVAQVKGGSPLMGSITGSGCALGTVIGGFVGAKADGATSEEFDIFNAVSGAVSFYNRCGSIAAEQCSTPGTYVPKFIDVLHTEAHCEN